MTIAPDRELLDQLGDVDRRARELLDQLGPPPLPRPTGAHLVTYWGDRFGRHHRRCSCGAGTPAPGMASGVAYAGPTGPQVADTLMRPCVDYSALAALLERAGRLIAARPIHGAAHATRSAGERRARGLAYLALAVAAAGGAPIPTGPVGNARAEPSTTAAGDASPTAAATHAEAPRPEPEPVSDQGGQQDGQAGRAADVVRGAEPDATPAPSPWRWYAPGWQKVPRCHSCGLHHYQRWGGGGHLRPCTPADPVTPTYDVCRECGYTLDPAAVALFDGRHAECSLPEAERRYWASCVREHGQLRRTRERTGR